METNPHASSPRAAVLLALYHYEACPYCLKVRRAAERLGIALELRDIRFVATHREELLAARGRPTVPVLRIESGPGRVRWLGESDEIVRWLAAHAGSRSPRRAPPTSAGGNGAHRTGLLVVAFAALGVLAAAWIGRQLLLP
jgi:glutathione S-transferase